MSTETLDKFYLEWSQFTKVKTAKEIALTQALIMIRDRALAEKKVDSNYIHQVISGVIMRCGQELCSPETN